ncbi:conjugative transposon protein TraN [Dysgonomonas sp. GY75]|uniref:conjugative transposon protein TraN n=1 Tax=Dysgonomonas sp. GY75 TaxID=2780419 RepID=UPI00188435F3|nr:conjugative transposon protein TraN [Dysgonomonas sp. GY75]MBF0647437.1 conjugative transposon protein TraN [Dysgonomonas sp. GY75]
MKNLIITLLLSALAITAFAQHTQGDLPAVQESPQAGEHGQGSSPSSGDLYYGLTRKIMYDRVIPPHGIEVTFDKTVHLIFPAPVVYVDLGSANIVAGKADGVGNILRVKAAVRDFSPETNFSVVTDEGNFYSFNVKYADEPQKLNIEMKDFIHDGQAVNRPNNSLDIYLNELGKETPKLARLIMKSVYDNDKRIYKHIGSKKFGIQFLLKGIYVYDGLLYLHTQIGNTTNLPYDIDFIRFKIVDKKILKRTAVQETLIVPVRAYNYVTRVEGQTAGRTVFAIGRITIPDDKQLVIDLYEQNGGRNHSLVIENADLVRAERINELKVK